MGHQPRLLVERSGAERVMQVAALGVVVSLLAYAIDVWPELPARVPSHFGASGPPDAWAGRASLLGLPAMALGFFAVLTVVERVPHRYNYPAEVTTENAERIYALGRRLVLSLKLIVVAAFAFVFRTAAHVALGKATALPGWFLPVVLGSTAGVILVTLVNMRAASAATSARGGR